MIFCRDTSGSAPPFFLIKDHAMSTGLLDLDHQIYDIILQLLALTLTIATKQSYIQLISAIENRRKKEGQLL